VEFAAVGQGTGAGQGAGRTALDGQRLCKVVAVGGGTLPASRLQPGRANAAKRKRAHTARAGCPTALAVGRSV